MERADANEANAQQLGQEVQRLHQEAERLAGEVARSEAESAALRADAETRGAALSALEDTLGRIEKAVSRAPPIWPLGCPLKGVTSTSPCWLWELG